MTLAERVATPVTTDVEVTPARGEQRSSAPPSHDLPTFVIDGHAHWRHWIADLSLYSGALRSLAWRNIRSRYKQAALGTSWAIVQPLVQVGVFTVLFGILAGVPSGDVPYPLFALVALLPWNLFAKIVSEGSASLVANQNIITKLYFPRIYLVIASGASALIDALVTVVLLIALMAFYGIAPTAATLLVAPVLLGVLLVSYGVAALLAALNARWRDIQHAVPFLIQIGLFVTPVLYQHSFVPERWRWLLALNPMTGFIETLRAATLGLPVPDASVLWLSFGIALLMIVVGVWYFRRTEAIIVDVV